MFAQLVATNKPNEQLIAFLYRVQLGVSVKSWNVICKMITISLPQPRTFHNNRHIETSQISGFFAGTNGYLNKIFNRPCKGKVFI